MCWKLIFTEVECEDLWQLDNTVALRSTALKIQYCDTFSHINTSRQLIVLGFGAACYVKKAIREWNP